MGFVRVGTSRRRVYSRVVMRVIRWKRPPTAAGAASGPLAVVRARHPRPAACPSSGCRTPTSSAMARRPRTRAAEGLLAGPSRGRRQVHPGVVRGARAAAGL